MAEQPQRLPAGGRIERNRPLRFTFDGRPYTGYHGDTLASALLANGVKLVGRSFKYHRPRGILTCGVEEPNALVSVGTGAKRDVNQRATTQELYDGLSAHSQNAWPSLNVDLGALNDLAAPLLPAGFYYKTFMGAGTHSWMLFERAIRQTAGLGPAPQDHPDPDRYEHLHAHADVLVVGAGPAGLMAALSAGRAGARVILMDEQAEFGGWLRNQSERIDGQPAATWLERICAELDSLPEVTCLPRTTCSGYFDHNFLTALQRVTDHLGADAPAHLPRQRLWKIRARRVVLTTGAIERPIAFAGNDRPGVMLAGAVRAYLNRYAVCPGKRAVLLTNNDDAYRTALDLHRAGCAVTVADLRQDAEGPLPQAARAAGIDVRPATGIGGTLGARALNGARLQRLDDSAGRLRDAGEAVACDLIAVSGGWNPTVHLYSQARGKLAYDPARGVFTPDSCAQDVHSAGAIDGVFDLAGCLAAGAEAGAAAARAAGFVAEPAALPAVETAAEAPWRVIWALSSDKHPRKAKAFVDYQHDVTTADIKLALQEGFTSVEHLKRYTTNGMATDQGKLSNVVALGLMAELTGRAVPAIGTTTFRPPYTPITLGAVVGAQRGALFDPVRTTPMHAWHVERGAVFEPVGQWQRARYYPQAGETMDQAVAREVAAVRGAVGLLDASTLGKIDLRGADIAELLNRLYSNAWSKLAVGAARYGLMLGEDGMVMDDGVTYRLGEHHFIMSTTTSGAAKVFAWIEEWLQTEWPELKVYATSITEQYAVATLAGPEARQVLRAAGTDIDLDNDALPFMRVREGRVAGVPARVARISFSGELSYEINVPARHGLHVWRALIAAGAPYGLTPYGTEAMHVLRAEKGFIIVGQDTDGTATPYDLNMAWAVSGKKADFLGKRSLARPDMQRDDRKQLVGLMTVDPNETLEEGAQLVEEVSGLPMPMIGHITSAYHSPSLGRYFALAMVRGGLHRRGQTLLVPMVDRTVAVEVCEPVFIDPQGERLRA